MAEHTKLPWHNSRKSVYVSDFNNNCLAQMLRGADENEANAAFIVKAVNSHNALVKALEGIAEFCNSDANTLGAIERLAHIRNTAVNVLAHVGSAQGSGK